MKRYILLTLMLLTFIGVSAQSIAVKSFKDLPMDMTASSLEGKRIDQNGQMAALIKVVTSQTGFTFEGGALGIVDTQQRNGEIWVWVPRASRKITILHQQLGVLRDYRYPIEIESERTYEMVLTTGKVETIVKQEVMQQYLAFQISPTNAVLEVEGELWEVASDGSAMKFVNFGTYNYRVQAPNYHTEVGKVTVNDPENTQIVPITLKPDFVEVTLKVDADAEIWVNNEKKGTRTWMGSLGKGTYKIECKQANHETTTVSQEITASTDGKTITLPAPIPIYGSLSIESTPNFAKVYIDGKLAGETPKYIPEILIGKHELRVTKQGYSDYKETITIEKGERKLIKALMSTPFKGFSTTENGLYYRFYKQTIGPKPQVGELVELAIRCTVNDTIIIVRDTISTLQMQVPLFAGDFYEGMAMMHKGDSASFIVNIDSTFIKFFSQPNLPDEFSSTDVMCFDVRLDDIYPESEYASRFAVKNNKVIDARIKKLKSDYPEETIIAARQLNDYLKKNGVKKAPTGSGLYYVMREKGNGDKPKVGQKVIVHYIGKMLDGTVFDSSYERGEPIILPIGVGQVIPGWDEGIQLMSKGEKGVLYIPYYLAYGDRQAGDKITPFSNLVFEVELIDFEDY